MSARSAPRAIRWPRQRVSGSVFLVAIAAALLFFLLSPAAHAQPLTGPLSAPQADKGIIVLPLDNDPDNLLYSCGTQRVPFGDRSIDAPRCLTFRYQVPRGGITRATVHLAIEPLGSLQDTDALAVAVAVPGPDCSWGAGQMPGCVTIHGGFRGDETAIDLDLMDLACNPSVKVSPEGQKLVRDQVQTGVLHLVLQDDTAVFSAQLVLNGAPVSFPCGASVRENAGEAPPGALAKEPGSDVARLVTGTASPKPMDPESTGKAAAAGVLSLGLLGVLNTLLSGNVADAAAALSGAISTAMSSAPSPAEAPRVSPKQDKLVQTTLTKSRDKLTGLVEPKEEKVWKCSACSQTNRENSKFCTNCGTRRMEGR